MIAHSADAVLEEDQTDEVLVERVRQGDNGAFEDLYRRHSRLAVSTARRILGSPQDAEDAAAEAFTNVLAALRRQVGPREMFRPYLMACVRNTCSLRLRQRSRQACAREQSLAEVDPRDDEKVVEGAVAAAAFHAIPARWQSALWMAEVQHLDPITIAERLDVNVASAAALVYRARQGFTEAYLGQHLRTSGQPACAALGPKLAQYVRGTAGTMATRQVTMHIEECQSCAVAVAELTDLNSSLRSMAPPVTLLAAAGATVAAAGGTATLGAAGIGFGSLGLGWLVKIAAIAALSAAPLLAGSESPTSAFATDASVTVDTSPESRDTAHGHAIADATAHGIHVTLEDATYSPEDSDRQKPGTTTTPIGTDSTVTDPGIAPVSVPNGVDGAVLQGDPDGVVSTAGGDLDGVTSTLPSIPAISVPPIAVPSITVPSITVPSITVPAISIPAITLPAISVPAITLPAIPTVPTPTLVPMHLGSGV